jgi:hypothetical protein
MSTELLDKIRERMLARKAEHAHDLEQNRLKQAVNFVEQARVARPLHKQWRMESPGDIDPISDEEATFCGIKISLLSKAIKRHVARRTAAEAEAARLAWENVKAPNAFKGRDSRVMPVRWNDTGGIQNPPEDDDIPF